MTFEDIRIGVVGCGYWGSKHVRVMRSLDVGAVVLVDSDPARRDALLRGTTDDEGFATLEAALPHVDAVVLATPPTSHVPLALRALDAGKHVLVEKPLATTSAGARLLIAKAAEVDRTLMVGHTFAYNPAVAKLRELVASGDIGHLHYLDSARLNLGLYQRDVNVVFDLAPHDVSIMNLVLGDTPTSVQAWGYRHAHRRFEDVAYLRLYYENAGVFANIHVSWLDPCKVRRVTAVGSRKMVVYNDLAEERIRVHDKGVAVPTEGDVTQPPTSYRYGDVVSPFVPTAEPLLVQDRHFLDCIVDGRVPITHGGAGLDVVEVLEAAELSLARSRLVFVDEVRQRVHAHDRVPRQSVIDLTTSVLPTPPDDKRLLQPSANGSATSGT